MCQIIEDEELACHSLSAEFIVTYDDAGNQQV
jgi:hypothetical protein